MSQLPLSRIGRDGPHIMAAPDESDLMADSLRALARALADYLNESVLDYERVSTADILDALASLGVTLVEDQIGESTLTYQELLSEHDSQPESDG